MWVVETGTALLNGEAFVADDKRKFRLKERAADYFEKFCAAHCQGGTGYWHGMRVKTARLYEM